IAVRESEGLPYGGLEDISTSRDFGFNSTTSLNYSKQFGKHTVDAGIYLEYIKAHATSNVTRQNGLDLLTYSFWSGAGYTNLGTQYPALVPVTSAAKAEAGL